jgi:hypothetical protein
MSIFSFFNPRVYTPINQGDLSGDTDLPGSTTNNVIQPSLLQPVPNTEQHKKLLEQNFITTIPLEVRLQVLNFVVRNRHPVVANDDLISYAQISKSALADVETYHATYDEPHQSLLASRALVKKAWEKAKSNSFFNRAEVFENELKKLATSYTAIYLDVRSLNSFISEIGCDMRLTLPQNPVQLGPECIAAVVRADKPKFIHLRLGFDRLDVSELGDYKYHKQSLRALMMESKQRLQRKVELPEFFLEVSGLKLSSLLFQIEKAERKAKLDCHLKISGLSLVGLKASAFSKIQTPTKDKVIRVSGYFDLSADRWLHCFKKLRQLKYLDLTGWPSDTMAEGLISWLKDYHRLEELHLSNCGLDNDSVLRLCQVLRDGNQLKFLGIDGYQYFDSDVEAELARLLENNPDLKIIFGKNFAADSPLELYRLNGRIICDRYHQQIRDLPEIYGATNFFTDGTH